MFDFEKWPDTTACVSEPLDTRQRCIWMYFKLVFMQVVSFYDESGPPHRFMCPLAALKTRDHLFLKKLKNILCFYFESLRLNGFML